MYVFLHVIYAIDSLKNINNLKQSGTRDNQLGVLIQVQGDKEICQEKLDQSLIKIKEVFYRVPNQLSHYPPQYFDENKDKERGATS